MVRFGDITAIGQFELAEVWGAVHHVAHLFQELPNQRAREHTHCQGRLMIRSRVLDKHFVEVLTIGDGTLGDVSLCPSLLLGLIDEFGEESADTLHEARRAWFFEHADAPVDKSIDDIWCLQSLDTLLDVRVQKDEEAAGLIINSIDFTIEGHSPD